MAAGNDDSIANAEVYAAFVAKLDTVLSVDVLADRDGERERVFDESYPYAPDIKRRDHLEAERFRDFDQARSILANTIESSPEHHRAVQAAINASRELPPPPTSGDGAILAELRNLRLDGWLAASDTTIEDVAAVYSEAVAAGDVTTMRVLEAPSTWRKLQSRAGRSSDVAKAAQKLHELHQTIENTKASRVPDRLRTLAEALDAAETRLREWKLVYSRAGAIGWDSAELRVRRESRKVKADAGA